jgi:hypothetical protein
LGLAEQEASSVASSSRKSPRPAKQASSPIGSSEGRLRVFISYSHEDRDLARRIAGILGECGLDPLYDHDFRLGEGFHEQIKIFIAHAHIFLPVLTPSAGTRNWVQQEIGYAVALHVPVLPLAVDCDPGELLHGTQAIAISRGRIRDIAHRLKRESLEQWLSSGTIGPALYECAETTDDRALLLARYSNDVLGLERSGTVRQKGGLSSFHIPLATPGHEIWRLRYGPLPPSPMHCRLLREERIALTGHAEKAGTRIVIDPDLDFKEYGDRARYARLRSIRDFLAGMTDGMCEVALCRRISGSLTIVGDWFSARSMYLRIGEGYWQTIFTRHAPTLKR